MKFFRRGISVVIFAPAVADLSAVSRIEMDAGEDLSAGITAMSGFSLSNSPIPTPNLRDKFTSSIPGEDTTADSTLTFNDDDTDEDIRTALAKDTAGFILLLPYGDVPTKRMETWPVVVTGYNDEWSLDNTSAKSVAGFAITGVPEQNGVVPALPVP